VPTPIKVWDDVNLGPVAKLIAEIASYYPNHRDIYITDGFRTGDGGHHGGLSYGGSPTAAVDFGAGGDTSAGRAKMDKFARWLKGLGVPNWVEIINTQNQGGTYIKNGRVVSAYAASGHRNHVHAATSKKGAETILRKLRETGSANPPPVTPPSTGWGIYGWDASDFDWDRGARPANLAKAKAEGIRFFTHKITEGTTTVHWHAGEMLKAAEAAGIPFLGAYVVVRTPGNGANRNITQQALFAKQQLDIQFPRWRTHPGFFLQVDLEHWDYDRVSPAFGVQMCAWLEKLFGVKTVLYAPKWSYGNTVGGNYPLWASNYGSNASKPFKDLPHGQNHDGWDEYSNRKPRILQYGSNAIIGGQKTCDANVFWGSEADFRKMIGKPSVEEELSVTAKEIAAIAAAVWTYQLKDANNNDVPVHAGFFMRWQANWFARTEDQLKALNEKLDALADRLPPAPSS